MPSTTVIGNPQMAWADVALCGFLCQVAPNNEGKTATRASCKYTLLLQMYSISNVSIVGKSTQA